MCAEKASSECRARSEMCPDIALPINVFSELRPAEPPSVLTRIFTKRSEAISTTAS